MEGNSIGICCEDLVTEVGLMCCSCFSAYNRFSKLKETIDTNINTVLHKLVVLTGNAAITEEKVSEAMKLNLS